MKSLFKAVTLIVVFSVITRALGFLFRIYLSRSLGAEMLGVYQVAFSFFVVLCTIISSGIPLVISRLTAKYQAKGEIVSERKMLSCALVLSLVSSALLCGIILILNKLLNLVLTDNRTIAVLFALLPAIVFNAIYGTFRGSLWGKSKFAGVCLSELFEQCMRILLAVLFLEGILKIFEGPVAAAIALSIASALSCVFIASIYFVMGGKLGKPKDHYKEILKISTPITFVRVATSLIQPLIAIIIPLRLVAFGYTSAQAMSLYGITIGMTMPLLFIPGAIIGALCTVLIPDLSTAVTKEDNNHITNRITTSVVFTMFVSFLFIPLYIGAGEHIGTFFYNNAQSGILLAKSAWIMLPLGLISVTSAILNALGLEMKSLKNYIPGAIIMMLCLWFLPKYVGIMAIVYGMGACVAIASILNLLMLKKHYENKLKFGKPFLLFIIFAIPSVAITSFTTNIMSHFFTLFFNLAISCSLGALFFVLLSIIFKVIDISSFVSSIKIKKLSRKNKNIKKLKFTKKRRIIVIN